MDYAKESLRLHGEWKGKIEVKATVPVGTKDDLSLAYTPGVAQPCLEIQRDPDKSYTLTRRHNLCAVITDGSAVLGLGDDDLISHDIWFVALGASDCDHAGMRAFLAEHRKQIRGSFVINLDSVGAGDLTMLSREGLLITRRADRRMLRMMSTIANDLHIPMGKAKYDWSATDATPAMLSSLRAMTIMGTDASGFRALSCTPDDVPENVVPEQAVAVAEAVTELIRRS